MPLYFLHLRERDHLVQDVEGTPFADLQSARTEARQAIRDIVAEHLESGEEVRLRTVEICDDQGNHVATVSLAISSVFALSQGRGRAEPSETINCVLMKQGRR